LNIHNVNLIGGGAFAHVDVQKHLKYTYKDVRFKTGNLVVHFRLLLKRFFLFWLQLCSPLICYADRETSVRRGGNCANNGTLVLIVLHIDFVHCKDYVRN